MATLASPIPIPISLETAYTWLYEYEENYLRPAARQLVKKMEENIGKGDFRIGWAMHKELVKYSEAPCATGEAIEILIICGWAAFHMRAEAEAIKMLRDAYPKAIIHKHLSAIAKWMLGYILWLLPHSNMNEAIAAWQDSIDLFDDLARQQALTSEKTKWYQVRCDAMIESLKKAIEDDGISLAAPGPGSRPSAPTPGPYPPGTGPRPVPPSSYPYPPSGPISASIKRHRIRSFPALGKIPAGTPANIAEQSGTIVFEDIILNDGLNDTHYRIVSLKRGESVINPPNGRDYYALKVSGNSMNKAEPEPIMDGDYVLIHAQNVADNGDIVAAEIVGVDERATLKRCFIDGGKLILSPESHDPAFQTPVLIGPGDKVYIRGVALAVLKRLED